MRRSIYSPRDWFRPTAAVKHTALPHSGLFSLTTMSAPDRSWPNLVGKTGEEAKKTIEQDDSSLQVVIVPENSMMTMDLRPDRVRIVVKEDGTVASPPMVG